MLEEGCSKADIVRKLGCSKSKITRGVSYRLEDTLD